MQRYLRLLLGLAILAAFYWRLGGFGPVSTSAEAPAPATVVVDSLSAAVGGPDDGPAFGFLPAGPAPQGTRSESMEGAEPLVPGLPSITDWEDLTIGRNESFYVALRRAGLEHAQIMAVVAACEEHTDLRRVRRGDTFLLARDEQGLRALRFDVGSESYLIVHREGDGFQAERIHYPIQRVVKAARGQIRTNLFDALQEEGADPSLADQMAEILGWNIDFFRDLRKGDEFVLLYAEFVHDQHSVRDPQVLAVHFRNRGHEYRAYRYQNELGLPAYYDENGQSLEKQFLRAPLKFTRISSGFSYRRLHPVTKRYRPHWGVDYVAPRGTPIFATAAGRVVEKKRDRASGNFVGIRHGNGYESFYLHLQGFARGLKVGDTVEQGEVIGFLGDTGWATAPHLDYRIKKNGKWVNPRKLDLPPAEPVGEDRLPEFRATVAAYDAQIEAVPVLARAVELERSLAEVPGTDPSTADLR